MAEKKRKLSLKESKERTTQNILRASVKMFLEQGFNSTKVTEIIKEAGCSISSFQNIFGTKDGLLFTLAEIMFSNQFEMARSIGGHNINPVIVYAVETSIQLTLTELNENLREAYVAAYSNQAAAEYIYKSTTEELKKIFSPYNPDCDDGDFYEFEIGSAGIMRGFMSRKCDQYFTLEKKIKKFLIMTLRSYNVPKKEIDEAIAFVLSLDIREISKQIMHKLFEMLAMQFHFELNEIEVNN
ncbi:MAG: TetR/AcrR family transcriptional regulator [Ruminococcus sp.]